MEFSKGKTEISDLQMDALRSRYSDATEIDKKNLDSDGRISFEFKDADRYKEMAEEKSVEIEDLEAKLNLFKKEKADAEKKYEQKKSKEKEKSAKKSKKQKRKDHNSLIRGIFNTAPIRIEEGDDEDPDVGKYRDARKKRASGKKAKPKDLVSEEKYPQRFAPVLGSVLEVKDELDTISTMVEVDLAKPGGSRMYKAQQFANLISLSKAKLDCSKELHNIGKTMSNLELKQDQKREDDTDSTKTINALGLNILRGVYDNDDDISEKKKNKKKKKDSWADEDDDGNYNKKKKSSDQALAKDFGSMIKGGSIELTAFEKHIHLEGKYEVVVVVDEDDDSSWKFMAVDIDSGKKMKDFPKELLPKKKKIKMKIDFDKGKAVDKQTKQPYRLYVK